LAWAFPVEFFILILLAYAINIMQKKRTGKRLRSSLFFIEKIHEEVTGH
jgi:hypothetical protein